MSQVFKLPFTLEECKIKAAILHKTLHSKDLAQAQSAISRFRCLALFANSVDFTVIADAKHKHALNVVAIENGFISWVNLKIYFEKTKQTNFILHSGFLNNWFSNYLEAKEYLRLAATSAVKFLLPYRNQFFICDVNFIEYIGFNPYIPEWELIGYNWVEPNDLRAWEHLNNTYLNMQKVVNHG